MSAELALLRSALYPQLINWTKGQFSVGTNRGNLVAASLGLAQNYAKELPKMACGN